jgi:hypothetical protein
MVRWVMVGVAVLAMGGWAMASKAPPPPEQTECPVMAGQPINKDLFTVYQGKTVYFCCEVCKGEFAKNPEKYLARLPQFQTTVAAAHDATPSHVSANGSQAEAPQPGLSPLKRFVEPTGIATLSLVALTVALGLFRRVWKPLLLLRIHKVCGVCALVSGLTHATLIALK